MGGLRTIMPITYLTCSIGALALAGIPPFAGFFSKDAIIESVKHSEIWGAHYAYIAVLSGVFITAFYSFRLLFMTFHGRNRADDHTRKHLHESPNVVTFPLIALAIPSIFAGFLFFEPVLTGTFFGDSVFALPGHDMVNRLAQIYEGKSGVGMVISAIGHGLFTAPFWLALSGMVFAWYCYCKNPTLPARIAGTFNPVYRILDKKYGIDELYQRIFSNGALLMGRVLHKYADAGLIDGVAVNGTAHSVGGFAGVIRQIQTGFTYHYAFAMIIGLFALMTFFVWF